jgi:two-component sensor histidine kinase
MAWTCIFVCGIGQSASSLHRQFESTIDSGQKASAALMLAQRYMHSKPDSALYFLSAARVLAADAELDSLHVMALMGIGKQLSLEAKFDDAIEYLREAQRVAINAGMHNFSAQYYNLIGRYFRYAQQYDSAAFYTTRYDDWLAAQGREGDRYLPQLDLTRLYYDLGDEEKAELHMQNALQFARIDKKPMNYLYTLLEAIQQYEERGNLKLASYLKEEYLQFKVEQGTDVLLDARHSHMNSPDQSPEAQAESILRYLPIHEQEKNWLSLAHASYGLGDLYLKQSLPEKAIPIYLKGLKGADSLGFKGMQLNLHLGLYGAYEANGQYQKSLIHLKSVYDLRENLRDMERQSLLNELSVKYETEKKDYQLEVAQFDLKSAQQSQTAYTIGILALIIIIGLILFTLYTKQKSNKQLADKNTIISKALADKDILLREIHHRVKNNLQMISALLYLQGKSIDDPSAQDAIRESRDRVQSMAMIHQNLYQDENLLGIEVKDYLDKLFDHLFASYNIKDEAIRLNKQIDSVNLDVDTVIPLALIVNELISNALKYAFTDDQQGQIDVLLHQDDVQLTLEVKDNGLGLATDFDPSLSGNFGFKLIGILCDQLDAQWKVSNENGTCVRITMKNDQAA